MTKTLNIPALIAAVRELAAEEPGFIYRFYADDPKLACSYFPNEKNPKGCIVGAAIRLVAPDFDLQPWEGQNAGDVVGDFATEEQSNWFNHVQGEQDAGKPWGEAVRLADVEQKLA